MGAEGLVYLTNLSYEISHNFKQLTTSFKNYVNLQSSLPRSLSSSISLEQRFPPLLADFFLSVFYVMVHFEGYSPGSIMSIDIFLQLQLKDKIPIEVKSNFHYKNRNKTENALHLNIFSHTHIYI